ncbi:cytochrome c oxidase, subunit VIb [Rhizoctonia solani]|nr:cytochrome c oxidase, subunit VIb [Rhizoctonia solani]
MSTPAPTREERKRCWQARDAYFGCLDNNKVIQPGKEGSACSRENKTYGQLCPAVWVEYFNKQRVLAERQRATLEAAERQNAARQNKK